jgi:hypothetical protein
MAVKIIIFREQEFLDIKIINIVINNSFFRGINRKTELLRKKNEIFCRVKIIYNIFKGLFVIFVYYLEIDTKMIYDC